MCRFISRHVEHLNVTRRISTPTHINLQIQSKEMASHSNVKSISTTQPPYKTTVQVFIFIQPCRSQRILLSPLYKNTLCNKKYAKSWILSEFLFLRMNIFALLWKGIFALRHHKAHIPGTLEIPIFLHFASFFSFGKQFTFWPVPKG